MISVLYTIILITNFKLIEMCIKSSSEGRGGKEGKRGMLFSHYYLSYSLFQRDLKKFSGRKFRNAFNMRDQHKDTPQHICLNSLSLL